jgi:uncharacterized phage protein gp47/JayE
MNLQFQNFLSLVEEMAAAVQGACAQLLDFSVGSVVRAIMEANASVALWLQWLIAQVLSMTRASTSVGLDLDSFIADYGVTRLQAVAATGYVQFYRQAAGYATQIPVGTIVRTGDGLSLFAVMADATNPAYAASSSAYLLLATAVSVSVPVQAQVAGSAGNVLAGAIQLLSSAIAGVDGVTNPATLSGGLDAESDAALRIRFQAFLDSRSNATPLAIGYAVVSVQQGLRWSLTENAAVGGGSAAGNFVLTVDDGTGLPPTVLLSEVATAVDLVRPVGTSFNIVPPATIAVDVALTINVAAVALAAATLAVTQAIQGYIAGLGFGGVLPVSRVAQLAYDAASSISNVTGITINGVAADLTAPANTVLLFSNVTVS